MGDYKKKHGKSRFSNLLSKVTQKLPELAGDVIEVAISGNPIGAAASKLKQKLAGTATGKIGDALLSEINNLPDEDLEAFKAEAADRQGARDMYSNTDHVQSDKIADRIMGKNLIYMGILTVINILVILFSEQLKLPTALIVTISNLVGMILQSLIQERAQVVGFYFGSSLGSKLKDKAKNIFTPN